MQNFTGARDRFGRKSFMMKRGLLLVLGFVALCLPAAAQQTNSLEQTITLKQLSLYQPEILGTLDYSTLLQGLPMPALLYARYLPTSSELGEMGTEPVDLVSDASYTVAEVDRIIVRPDHSKDSTKDSPAEVMNPQSNPIYYGGEVGFLYGHASGKFGGDLLDTYMVGTVGDDKFQITVGASYQESNSRLPRRFR
jgi:hypothetical protein